MKHETEPVLPKLAAVTESRSPCVEPAGSVTAP